VKRFLCQFVRWIASGAVLVGLTVSASAQTTSPAAPSASEVAAPPAASSAIERQPIRRTASPSTSAGAAPSAGAPAPGSGLELPRVLLAVGIVVALIILLRVLVRWLFPTASAARSTQAVRVLSRAVISPKQQVLLLQVGRRVIVVGDSGTQMNPLCEISDPDELAQLMGQIESERRTVVRPFLPFLRREREPLEELTQDESDVNALPDAPAPNADAAPADVGLAHAQGELRGLIEQVRSLGRQFRKS
jgi:flagellar biogenesis protein FliO